MIKNKDTGYVYLFINTKQIIDGLFMAKYGFTRSSLKNRLYYAQRATGLKFDIQVVLKVKNPCKVETNIKWNWLDSDGFKYFMGSEFVGIKPDDVGLAVRNFRSLACEC